MSRMSGAWFGILLVSAVGALAGKKDKAADSEVQQVTVVDTQWSIGDAGMNTRRKDVVRRYERVRRTKAKKALDVEAFLQSVGDGNMWMVEWCQGQSHMGRFWGPLQLRIGAAITFTHMHVDAPVTHGAIRVLEDAWGQSIVPGTVTLFNAVPKKFLQQNQRSNEGAPDDASALGRVLKFDSFRSPLSDQRQWMAWIQNSAPRLYYEVTKTATLETFLFAPESLQDSDRGSEFPIRKLIISVDETSPAGLERDEIRLILMALSIKYYDRLHIGVVFVPDMLEAKAKKRKFFGELNQLFQFEDEDYDPDRPGGFREGSRVEVVESDAEHMVGLQGIVGDDRGRGRVEVTFPEGTVPGTEGQVTKPYRVRALKQVYVGESGLVLVESVAEDRTAVRFVQHRGPLEYENVVSFVESYVAREDNEVTLFERRKEEEVRKVTAHSGEELTDMVDDLGIFDGTASVDTLHTYLWNTNRDY
eukprot:TRINITY_DN2976_c0_g1_i1.p1 TRINITY_DN2976_c0_g1~~TRINITY_DN2976_c0_g1_i1.p1  ORF type:complete len:474 (+),score=152.77 TRINITY_DN2976_c0_g1_i1:92-1513(+)